MAVAAGCAAQPQARDVAAPLERRREVRDGALDAAVALAVEGRYDEAAAQFSALMQRYDAAGDRARLAESLFWLGYCREKLGRPDEARDLYERVVRDHPAGPAARQAAERLGRLAPAPP
jgi:TolA-binding protein